MVNLDQVKTVAILGDIHTGKTNLAVSMLREYKGDKQIYLVGYPKQIDDFKNISFFNDLFKLTDSIIFIDEIQKFINIYDRRRVHEFIELLSFFAHNNNTLIFTTCLSQFIPKRLEPYLDCWCMTRIMDVEGLKNGGKAKRIIKNTTHHKSTKWSLALPNGEYLEHCEINDIEENGVKTFEYQKIGKDWRLKPPKIKINEHYMKQEKPEEDQETESFIKEKRPEKCPENLPLKRPLKRPLKNSQKKQKEPKSLQEIKGLRPIDKERLNQETPKPKVKTPEDKELERLAWGGKK